MKDRRTFVVAQWTVVLLLLLALVLGVTRRAFDYDEIEHAHATWLVARGDVPFHDFFECHPPFVWYLFAALTSTIDTSFALLLALRIVTVAGNLACLGLILANLQLGRPAADWPSSFLAVMLPACAPANLAYLVELRIDSWPMAALLAGILLLRVRWPATDVVRYAVFAAVAIICSAASPKLATMAALVGAFELVRRPRRLVTLAGCTIGVAVGLCAVAAFLAVAGIDPVLSWRLIVSFHMLFARGASFDTNLAGALLQQPLLLALIAIGAVLWLRRAAKADVFETVVFLHLVFQVASVDFPYKQYYAPWFLFGATFIAFVLRSSPKVRPVATWAAVAIVAFSAALGVAQYLKTTGVAKERSWFRLLGRMRLPADARVLTPVPLHPITMRDASYGWLRSIDPMGGYETEAVMRDLAVPGFSNRFTMEYYLLELEQNRPALIAMGEEGELRLAPLQSAAVHMYLRRHPRDYRMIREDAVTVWWLDRPGPAAAAPR